MDAAVTRAVRKGSRVALKVTAACRAAVNRACLHLNAPLPPKMTSVCGGTYAEQRRGAAPPFFTSPAAAGSEDPSPPRTEKSTVTQGRGFKPAHYLTGPAEKGACLPFMKTNASLDCGELRRMRAELTERHFLQKSARAVFTRLNSVHFSSGTFKDATLFF